MKVFKPIDDTDTVAWGLRTMLEANGLDGYGVAPLVGQRSRSEQ